MVTKVKNSQGVLAGVGWGGSERTRASKIQVRKKGPKGGPKGKPPGLLVSDKERKWSTLLFLLMGLGI